jgi:hypothetical protein
VRENILRVTIMRNNSDRVAVPTRYLTRENSFRAKIKTRLSPFFTGALPFIILQKNQSSDKHVYRKAHVLLSMTQGNLSFGPVQSDSSSII